MGYFLTTEPENAVPPKSRVMPKTHTPGSRVEERGYRFYGPEAGGWTSRDPMGEKGGRNLYAALKNSPISRIDPRGLKSCVDSDLYNKCMTIPEAALKNCEQLAQENLKLCNQGVDELFNKCMGLCDKIETTALRLACKAICVGIKMQYAGCEEAYLSSLALCTTIYGYEAALCLAASSYQVQNGCPCNK